MALADYTQAIALDANYGLAYYQRGVLNRELKKYDLAKPDLSKARQLFTASGDTSFAEHIGRLLENTP